MDAFIEFGFPRSPRAAGTLDHRDPRRPLKVLWALASGLAATSATAQVEYVNSNLPILPPPPPLPPSPTAGQPYTLKSGDFRLLLTPSATVEWNDNVNTTDANQADDVILRPMLDLVATYPISHNNLLRVNAGIGYDFYTDHDELNTWRLRSGSALSFDIAVKDVTINLRDRFDYVRDAARQGDVAGTSEQGNIRNTAGVGISWPLGKAFLGAGFDHQNQWSTVERLEYQDRASEIASLRSGFQLHPQLVAGLEGSVAFSAYDLPVLNDSTGYNAGVFADWDLGTSIQIQPRFGYSIYDFDQTSVFILAEDTDAWYADLTVQHRFREALSYSVTAGHELRLGVQSDVVNAWYVRPGLNWQITDRISVNPSFFYENGTQGGSPFAGIAAEDYDWYGANLRVTGSLTKKLRLALGYRFTVRDSSAANRDYTQNLVSLNLTYLMQ